MLFVFIFQRLPVLPISFIKSVLARASPPVSLYLIRCWDARKSVYKAATVRKVFFWMPMEIV